MKNHNRNIACLAVGLTGSLLLSTFPVEGAAHPPLLTAVQNGMEARYSDVDLLKKSQISYRADGGFSNVRSYGVIISCVNGKISVMKTIADPNIPDADSAVHEVSSLDPREYLDLWASLDRHHFFSIPDAPAPKVEIADEFTLTFHASVGDIEHEFAALGIKRPEAARQFAIRELIDNTVHMKSLWNIHSNVARAELEE